MTPHTRITGTGIPSQEELISYVPSGGLSAQAELAHPVGDTLFFAGEATNTEGHNGTVHGAIATGLRAASEVLGSAARAGDL